MSTLGFGDITFTSDIGKLFSIIVLVSGIILIMIVMPFTFIRFVYQPWIEEYNNKRKPRSLPSDTSGHTVLVGDNDISLSVARKLRQHNYPYVILVPDGQHALELYDNRYDVVTGEFDDANTYRNLRADKAALLAALEGDLRNTNIASTVREVAPSTLLAASAENPEAMNILMLAGCDHVYSFTEMLGGALPPRLRDPRPVEHHRPVRDVVPCRGAGHPHRVHGADAARVRVPRTLRPQRGRAVGGQFLYVRAPGQPDRRGLHPAARGDGGSA